MNKKAELLAKVKKIEQQKIKNGVLKNRISGYFHINKNASIKQIKEFAKVCLFTDI